MGCNSDNRKKPDMVDRPKSVVDGVKKKKKSSNVDSQKLFVCLFLSILHLLLLIRILDFAYNEGLCWGLFSLWGHQVLKARMSQEEEEESLRVCSDLRGQGVTLAAPNESDQKKQQLVIEHLSNVLEAGGYGQIATTCSSLIAFGLEQYVTLRQNLAWCYELLSYIVMTLQHIRKAHTLMLTSPKLLSPEKHNLFKDAAFFTMQSIFTIFKSLDHSSISWYLHAFIDKEDICEQPKNTTIVSSCGPTFPKIVGMEDKAREVVDLLAFGESKSNNEATRCVCLMGMGGVGKSTLVSSCGPTSPKIVGMEDKAREVVDLLAFGESKSNNEATRCVCLMGMRGVRKSIQVSSCGPTSPKIVGMEDKAREIVDLLAFGESKSNIEATRCVCLMGMGGVGKSTLVSSFVSTFSKIVGMEDKASEVVDLLAFGERKSNNEATRCVCLMGMRGVGKSTLVSSCGYTSPKIVGMEDKAREVVDLLAFGESKSNNEATRCVCLMGIGGVGKSMFASCGPTSPKIVGMEDKAIKVMDLLAFGESKNNNEQHDMCA